MVPEIDPKVDYAFKHVMGREPTRPILIDVLNKVLGLPPGRQIQEIELLNPFNPKKAVDDKMSILDIKARDENGRLYNIEMQLIAQRFYRKRILYYATKLHQQQLREGERYDALRPTISISFLNDIIFPASPDYHLRFQLLETLHHFAFSDDIEFHILELPKFKKSPEQLGDDLDVWLYFLLHAEKIDTEALPAAPQRNPQVVRAMEELQMLIQNELERERYEARRKAQLDYDSGLDDARNEGVEIGFEKGRQESVEKGRQIDTIHAFERSLNRPDTPTERLLRLSQQDLTRMAEELQSQISKQ